MVLLLLWADLVRVVKKMPIGNRACRGIGRHFEPSCVRAHGHRQLRLQHRECLKSLTPSHICCVQLVALVWAFLPRTLETHDSSHQFNTIAPKLPHAISFKSKAIGSFI